MNLIKKPAEYTLTLTHEELLLLERIVYDWRSPAIRPEMPPSVIPFCNQLARDIEQAGIKARGGVA